MECTLSVNRLFQTRIVSLGCLLLLLHILFSLPNSNAQASVYFSFDAESGTVGNDLPLPPFCGWPCGADNYTSCGTRPKYGSTGGAPQGSKYYYWNIAHPGLSGQSGAQMCPSVPDGTPDHYVTNAGDGRNSGQHDHGAELRTGSYTITGFMDKTLYVAYFFRFDTSADSNFPSYRQNVFQIGASTSATSNVQSAEKGVELVGEALRWEISKGQWDSYYGNTANHFTLYLGNPSHHLNPSLEHNDVYWQNQNGYSQTNPYQLAYNMALGCYASYDEAEQYRSCGAVGEWDENSRIHWHPDRQYRRERKRQHHDGGYAVPAGL